MAVVTRYGSAAYNPSVPSTLEGVERCGHVKRLGTTLEIANGDSATSTLNFGAVASNARLCGHSTLRFDALTGVTDFDLGTTGHVDLLVNGVDLHTAGSALAVSAVDIANLGKPLWQILGFAKDPGGSIDIIGTLNTAATAAGTITLELFFCTP